MDTEYVLIKRMRRGDDVAFDAFVHKYYKDILRYCTYHCFDAEEAKDLTQETFLHFFSGFDLYTHEGKVKNYLYTIAGNLCRNFYKRQEDSPLILLMKCHYQRIRTISYPHRLRSVCILTDCLRNYGKLLSCITIRI